jgi:hypothetical protein
MVFISSVPQYIANVKHRNCHSFLIPSPEGYSGGLYLWQLSKGITLQKYETNVNTLLGQAQVEYHDPSGIQIDKLESLGGTLKSYNHFITIICKYPVDFIPIYFRHLYNGFSVQHPEVYIHDILRPKFGFALLTSFIFFLFIISFKYYPIRYHHSQLPVMGILVTLIFIIPTAVEERFFFPFITIAVYRSIMVLNKRSFTNLKVVNIIYLFLLFFVILTLNLVLLQNQYREVSNPASFIFGFDPSKGLENLFFQY